MVAMGPRIKGGDVADWLTQGRSAKLVSVQWVTHGSLDSAVVDGEGRFARVKVSGRIFQCFNRTPTRPPR